MTKNTFLKNPDNLVQFLLLCKYHLIEEKARWVSVVDLLVLTIFNQPLYSLPLQLVFIAMTLPNDNVSIPANEPLCMIASLQKSLG